jgi:hypothetical protein
MTEEQRIFLHTALTEVHNHIHTLYPKGDTIAESDKRFRNQLLVVDLVVHLAQEVIESLPPNEQQVAERTANLLYAVRLIAPNYPLEQAAKLLLDHEKALTD